MTQVTARPRPPRPPGPKGQFLLGNLPALGKDLIGFLTRCARDYGDIVALRLFNMPAFLLNNPDLIEYVLVTNQRNFIKHSFFWRHVTAVFGNGLLTSEGDFWLRERRLCQPAFHREQVAAYGAVMVDFTERAVAEWRDGDVRDVHQDMMGLTSRIAAQTLLGADVGSDVDQVEPALDVVIEQIAVRFKRPFAFPDAVPTPGNLRYRKAVHRLNDLIYKVIRERRAATSRSDDLLSLLLHAQDIDGTRMTDRQLRDEAITLFLAGHETTALALSWTWYLLSQHPEVEAKLWAELAAVLGGRSPSVADLDRLRYTGMVVMESLRLYPPAYVMGREAVNDCEIGGYPVGRGNTVFVSQWLMHHDARYFENPDAFLPERWADGLAKRLPKYAYFPFGGGPRMCIGSNFAAIEAALLLATIAQRFRLTLVPGHPIELLPSITLRPKHGIRVVVARR
jgi:cytochrome P450